MQQRAVFETRDRVAERHGSVAHAMLESFARGGVTAAFGIPGGLVSPLFDAIAGQSTIRLVSTRHEAMAGFAAMGHFVATGNPALVLTTSGPGITNAITAIAAADAEEIPLVVVGGEIPSRALSRGGFQDGSSNALDAVAMMRTITRASRRVEHPDGAAAAVAHALRVARGPRPGPVFLSVPLDVATRPAHAYAISVPPDDAPPAAEASACARIAWHLANARRPLLVIGQGARSAATLVRALAEAVDAPVVCTAHAKGIFPDDHALHLGIIGFGGHASAAEYLAAAPDVVVVVGSRLGEFATNGWSVPLCGTTATYQIDRDPAVLGRNYPLTLGVVSDASAALRGILDVLPATDTEAPRSRRVRRARHAGATSDAVPLKPARVLAALEEAFPDAFWTSDIGEHAAHVVHHVSIDRPERFRAMFGIASMGSGIGTAIGVKLARPELPVLCVCGDGGFAMHAGDLLTCVENDIGVVFVVMNDGRWNMVQHGFRAVYGREPEALPARVADLAQVARGFGAIGVTIGAPKDLCLERLQGLAAIGRPIVLDVRIDPEESLSVGSRSAAVQKAAFGGAA